MSAYFLSQESIPSDYLRQATCGTLGVMLNFDATQHYAAKRRTQQVLYEVTFIRTHRQFQDWIRQTSHRATLAGGGCLVSICGTTAKGKLKRIAFPVQKRVSFPKRGKASACVWSLGPRNKRQKKFGHKKSRPEFPACPSSAPESGSPLPRWGPRPLSWIRILEHHVLQSQHIQLLAQMVGCSLD